MDIFARIKLEKKHKYIILSSVVGFLVFWFAYTPVENMFRVAVLTFVVSLVGTILTQYPNVTFKNIISIYLLPFHLISGILLSLLFFPNLSIVFKASAIVAFSVVYYIVSLVNNVFLVVEDKSDTIPLYRAALTWNQILIIIVSIPFYAGIFKLPINSIYQNIIITISTAIFCVYSLWAMRYDKDTKPAGRGEKVTLILFVAFMAFLYGTVAAFFPTESFLRALFVSTALLFGLSYIFGHLKNNITKNLISEYIIISVIFFILLLIFSN